MTSEAPLEGRVALVTGGARGVGRGIVETLIENGARVVIADNGVSISGEEESPGIAADVAGDLGEAAVGCARSIAEADGAAEAVKTAVDRFGGLDIVVNNAAIMRDAFIFKADPEAFEQVQRINLFGAFHVLAAATPVLRAQHKAGRHGGAAGRIVNIVSTAGLYGNFGQSAYASAKAGLVGLTRVVAHDMARSKVTCNAVAPFAATRVTDMIVPANDAQATYKERALRIAPRHVGNFVSYLGSHTAADVSGQLFGVRGREVFLFSQPRPVARIVDEAGAWTVESLDRAVRKEFTEDFSDLITDLEAFNTEPVV